MFGVIGPAYRMSPAPDAEDTNAKCVAVQPVPVALVVGKVIDAAGDTDVGEVPDTVKPAPRVIATRA